MTEAHQFLGLRRLGQSNRWQLEVRPELSTPGKFLFGGCGLAGAVAALENSCGRPAIWATAQYLSYARLGATVEYEVIRAAHGRHVTQARAVASVDDQEILTVNAALGEPVMPLEAVWDVPPDVPPPEECPPRRFPSQFAQTIVEEIEVRVARGRPYEEVEKGAGDPEPALWAKLPGELTPSAATLAIFGDYVSNGLSQPLGRYTMTRSLDNTLRIVKLVPTAWVLCDIRMHAAIGGYAHGTAFLWAQDGSLLAIASQSLSFRYREKDHFWPDR